LLDAGWRPRFAADAVVRHAVMPGGIRRQVARSKQYGNWPAVVRAHPRIRQELLFGRWFLNRRTAAYDAAVLGCVAALATRRWSLLALATPYAALRVPRRGGRLGAKDLLAAAVVDSAVCAALVAGSIRERCIVV
jgi:hypothetical protein